MERHCCARTDVWCYLCFLLVSSVSQSQSAVKVNSFGHRFLKMPVMSDSGFCVAVRGPVYRHTGNAF